MYSLGKLRKEIIDVYEDDRTDPQIFKEELELWIDDIGAQIYKIIDLMSIEDLSDIENIEEAKDKLEDLYRLLY